MLNIDIRFDATTVYCGEWAFHNVLHSSLWGDELIFTIESYEDINMDGFTESRWTGEVVANDL